ncbi:MAG: hypothetical protein LBU07_04705 [Coriobacteriales bacterium]|nr:hypothetical protein [Coriobacteriales bacterium]
MPAVAKALCLGAVILVSLALAPMALAAETPNEDIESIEKVGTISLDDDAVNPDDMVLVNDRYLYIANEGMGDPNRGGSIYVVDVTTNKAIERLWFDNYPWFMGGIIVDLYQGENGYIYASFPDEGHVVVLDPAKPTGEKIVGDFDLKALTGNPAVYNQSMAIANDTIFIGDDDGNAGIMMLPLDGSSVRTHPLTEDARPFIPEQLLPLYETATAEALAVSSDGSFLYVGAYLEMQGTDGRGLFMAYAVASDGSLSLVHAMLCERQELIQTIVVTPQHVYAPCFIPTTVEEVDHDVYVFDNNAGSVTTSGRIDLVRTVQTAFYAPNGLLYITLQAGDGGAFVVIDPMAGNLGEVVYEVSNKDDRLVGLAFSADGTCIYASNLGGGVGSPAALITIYGLTFASEQLEEDSPPSPNPPAPDPNALPSTGDASGAVLALSCLLAAGGTFLLLFGARRICKRFAGCP